MLCETVYLRENEGDMSVRLETLVCKRDGDMTDIKPRDAVIVLPGGAYFFLAEREGEPVAKQFLAAGFNAFVLYYSIGDGEKGAKFPRPLMDVSLAIAHVRRNAEKYNVNPDRIFVAGSSAGGHLAGSIGTFWNRDWAAFDGMEKGENRPCGVILSYPVVTMSELGHETSRNVICGSDAPSDELKELYSLEKQVTEDTVPHFIWQTEADDCVPVENSMLLASALIAKKVPVELHIYPFGPHGMSVSNGEVDCGYPAMNDPHVAGWVRAAIEWTKIV